MTPEKYSGSWSRSGYPRINLTSNIAIPCGLVPVNGELIISNKIEGLSNSTGNVKCSQDMPVTLWKSASENLNCC